MTIHARRQQTIPSSLRGLALLALFAIALLVSAGPAAAAKSCGKKVVDDWYADGRVDGSYPAHCYDDAIEILPRDVRDYSSAKDDITRALQAHLSGKAAPPATTDPTPGDGDPPQTQPLPKTTKSTKTTKTTKTTKSTETTPGPTDGPRTKVADGPVDTASADSVPIPLLVLAGLALLLVAAGAAGYLARRLQARRLPPPPGV